LIADGLLFAQRLDGLSTTTSNYLLTDSLSTNQIAYAVHPYFKSLADQDGDPYYPNDRSMGHRR
jgi:hypothetical protein